MKENKLKWNCCIIFKKTIVLFIALVILGLTYFYLAPPNEETEINPLKVLDIPKVITSEKSKVKSENKPVDLTQIDTTQEDKDVSECNSELEINGEVYFESVQHFLQSLVDSNLQDKQLEYALFAEPPEGKLKLDLLFEYNERFPNDSTVLMEAISLCASSLDNPLCNQEFVDMAIAANKDNGAAWFLVAMIHIAKGDDENVINSIDELTKTSFYSEMYTEKIKLFVRAMESSNTNDFRENLIAAIGIEAARFPNYSKLVAWCENAVNDAKKANACMQLGSNLEKRSKILIAQMIGIGLQKIIFKAEGNIKSYQLLENEGQKLKGVIHSEHFQKASILMDKDEKLMRDWFNNMETMGEVESARLLVEETISLSQNGNPSPCLN